MTAATIANVIRTADPAAEVVVLTASDGETYESKKFKKITGASATSNFDASGTPVHVTFTGAVATIVFTGATDKTVTLKLWGH